MPFISQNKKIAISLCAITAVISGAALYISFSFDNQFSISAISIATSISCLIGLIKKKLSPLIVVVIG